jgi:hypothetical protein
VTDVKVLKRRIERAIRRYAQATSSQAYSLVPTSLTLGKLYEAHVLSLVLERLYRDERLRIVLVNSNLIPLKSAPGPVNPQYPHFDLFRRNYKIAEIWTDVEFLTLSYDQSGGSGMPSSGDYHELDIAVINPGISGYPRHNDIWLGIECKNTGYTKALIREILGVRRELSLLHGPHQTHFSMWPRSMVPAEPPSCLVVYSTDPAIVNYASPGIVFGIDFFHETL